jgi:hypothetical protein
MIFAISIHVDTFLGQTYVALSRATTLDGLQVVGFNPSKVGHSRHHSDDKHILTSSRRCRCIARSLSGAGRLKRFRN